MSRVADILDELGFLGGLVVKNPPAVQETQEASLVAQRIKRLPAMQETWVRSLGREDPLE